MDWLALLGGRPRACLAAPGGIATWMLLNGCCCVLCSNTERCCTNVWAQIATIRPTLSCQQICVFGPLLLWQRLRWEGRQRGAQLVARGCGCDCTTLPVVPDLQRLHQSKYCTPVQECVAVMATFVLACWVDWRGCTSLLVQQ